MIQEVHVWFLRGVGNSLTPPSDRVGNSLLDASATMAHLGWRFEEDDWSKAPSHPTTLKPSTALCERAKKAKARTREKLRRDALNSRYQELSAVLELGESMKSDQAALVSAATDSIKRLRAEHARLANLIMRFQDEKSQKADLLRALAVEREQLVKEKAQLLEEKLHVEGQLQRFLTSMPFGSLDQT